MKWPNASENIIILCTFYLSECSSKCHLKIAKVIEIIYRKKRSTWDLPGIFIWVVPIKFWLQSEHTTRKYVVGISFFSYRYLFFGKRRRYLVTFKMQRMLFSFSKKGRHISPTMYFFPILQQYNYVLFLSYDKLHSPLFGDRSAKNLKELLTYERRLGLCCSTLTFRILHFEM